MALTSLGRTLINKPKALSSAFTRSFITKSHPSPLSSLLHPIQSTPKLPLFNGDSSLSRSFSTRTIRSSSDHSRNLANGPPKEAILLDGCDFEHWLVVLDKPEGELSRDEIIDHYIKIVASVVGSEEDARQKIYSVSTRHYFAIGVLVPEEVSCKFKEMPNVRWVLPDSYLNVREKDYGGEPFINGQALPYDPKYHEEWLKNSIKSQQPRNNRRPNNIDRRGGGGNRGPPPRGSGSGGPPAQRPNMESPPPQYVNAQTTAPQSGGPQPNYNPGPPRIAGPSNGYPNGGHGNNAQNTGPQYGGPQPNYDVGPPRNAGRPNGGPAQNTGPQYGSPQPNNNSGPPRTAGPSDGYPNAGPVYNTQNTGPPYGGPQPIYNPGPSRSTGPSGGYPNGGTAPCYPNSGNMQYNTNGGRAPPPYSGGPMSNRGYENSYPSPTNRNTGPSSGNNVYQVRDVPGRD